MTLNEEMSYKGDALGTCDMKNMINDATYSFLFTTHSQSNQHLSGQQTSS